MDKHLPSIERLKELFTVLADGTLINKVTRSSRAIAGGIAGNQGLAYGRVHFDGNVIGVHRVVFAMTNGRWPDGVVDHIDGNPRNNHPANLRDVQQPTNAHNIYKAYSCGSSGLLGAHKSGRKWRASIWANGRQIQLGTYLTPEEAHEAYMAAKLIHHADAMEGRNG
jgi:hypothetical protein